MPIKNLPEHEMCRLEDGILNLFKEGDYCISLAIAKEIFSEVIARIENMEISFSEGSSLNSSYYKKLQQRLAEEAPTGPTE